MSGYRDLHYTTPTPPSSISPHVGRSHPRKTSGGVLLRAVCGFFFPFSHKKEGCGRAGSSESWPRRFLPRVLRGSESGREEKQPGTIVPQFRPGRQPHGKKYEAPYSSLVSALSHPFHCLNYRRPKLSRPFPRSLTATSHHSVLYSVGQPTNQIIRFPEARSRLVAPAMMPGAAHVRWAPKPGGL